MPTAPVPANEPARLRALRELALLDTPPDRRLDALARAAARRLAVPTVAISLIDANRQWFKARHGFDIQQTGRDDSICAHVIVESAPLIVEDASMDPRFADSVLVKRPPSLRFYAGIPLVLPTGEAIGSACAIDYRTRRVDAAWIAGLVGFARAAMTRILVLCEIHRDDAGQAMSRRSSTAWQATSTSPLRV